MDQFPSSIPENTDDYYGKDGLLYCGKCHTPREAFFAKGVALMGKNKHPVECSCQRTERKKQEALINQQKHLDRVRRLKAEGFSDPAMLDWTFENDNGRSPQMYHAHRYVEQWQAMRSENLGLLLWGGVGTGKSFLAGCIANALMEQEVPVSMTNFARILNELNSSFSGRNDIVDKLCRYPLLIIDDFGMERGTEYALEQIYSIVDSRYRSRKPLIVTTNLTLDEIRHPQNTAHARIYDRLLEMCIPISCIGVSFRKETAQEKLERMKLLIGSTQNIGKQKLPGAKVTRLQGIGGLPMNLNRPDMTETVKSENYTNKSLQKDSIPTTMEVVTQTNAVKSPTDSPATTKLVYTVEEIARMLAISLRSAYNLCNSTTEFRVLRVGGSIRVPKDSFDAWLNRAA